MERFRIYLDIDGVLVSYKNLKNKMDDNRQYFLEESVEALNNLVELFDAEIHIISSWLSYGMDEIKMIFKKRGILTDEIYSGKSHNRCEYILEEKNKGYENFLIIDDESYFYYKRMDEIGFHRILTTNPYGCLRNYHYEFIKFNKKKYIN